MPVSYDDLRRRYFRLLRREDHALVLDYKPQGNPFDRHKRHRNKPIAQAIGTRYFTLMEFYPVPGVDLKPLEKVYMGFRLKELRDKVEYVCDDPVTYEDLTDYAKGILPEAVRKIVEENERVFVEFFNMAQPISVRLHTLELLPGIGKKKLWKILEERQKEPFKSFEDIKNRTHIDPVKLVSERIVKEIEGEERYYLFIVPLTPPLSARLLNYLDIIYGRLGY